MIVHHVGRGEYVVVFGDDVGVRDYVAVFVNDLGVHDIRVGGNHIAVNCVHIVQHHRGDDTRG